MKTIRGRIGNVGEKLAEIVEKHLKSLLRPEARLIKCSKCSYFGGEILELGITNLKIPSVLIIEYQNRGGFAQDQSMYPLTLSEEICFQEYELNKVNIFYNLLKGGMVKLN